MTEWVILNIPAYAPTWIHSKCAICFTLCDAVLVPFDKLENRIESNLTILQIKKCSKASQLLKKMVSKYTSKSLALSLCLSRLAQVSSIINVFTLHHIFNQHTCGPSDTHLPILLCPVKRIGPNISQNLQIQNRNTWRTIVRSFVCGNIRLYSSFHNRGQ